MHDRGTNPLIPNVKACAGVFGVGFLCALLAGCGDGQSRLVPVSGIVTRDGKPLARALVEFEPVPGRAGDPSFNPSSAGTTDEEGRFRLDTRFGSGAVVGEHAVKIWEEVKVESEEQPEQEEKWEYKLLPESSDPGLSFTVPEDGTKEANFTLRSTVVMTTPSEAGEPSPGARTPTRTAAGAPPRRSPRRTSRTLWCVATVSLWLLALTGCFSWWRRNERRMLERI
jgi:hypothetical protein